MSLRPYVAASNTRLCHACGRPVVSVPLVPFIKRGNEVTGEVIGEGNSGEATRSAPPVAGGACATTRASTS